MNVSGNAVLQPKLGGDNMKSILAMFQGLAPLAAAPTQVFETTTTATATTTTVQGSTSTSVSPTVSPTTAPATTAPAAPTAAPTTVVGPEENGKGDIVPSADITC
jgi:hypothetical protein